MNNPSDAYLLNRVDALESRVGELRQAMLRAGLLPEPVVTLVEPVQDAPPGLGEPEKRPAFVGTGNVESAPARNDAARSGAQRAPSEKCPFCHNENAADAPLCERCGEPLLASLGLPQAVDAVPEHRGVPERQDEKPLTVYGKLRRSSEVERLAVGEQSMLERVALEPERPVKGPPREPFKLQFDVLRSAEFWLNKVGIVLFLFGVVFLFRYAMDRHWLNEQARVGAGLLLGSVLLGFGLFLRGQRRHLSQVLLGGAIATYYITGYAAYNIFPTLQVPYGAAITFMLAVTLLAFVLSLWHGEVVLALIGVTGGLLTPFALSFSEVQVPGLIMHTTLIILGTSAIYMQRGWRSLLWSACNGGLSVLMVAHAIAREKWFLDPAMIEDRFYMQAGVIVGLLAFWLVPVVHQLLWRRNPSRWQHPSLDSARFPEFRKLADAHVYLLCALALPVGLVWSWVIWSYNWSSGPGFVPLQAWGVISMACAAATFGVFLLLRRNERGLAYLHALLGVGLITLGLTQLLEGNLLLLALAMEGLALLLIALKYSDRGMEICGHALFAAAGLWLVPRLATAVGDVSPMLNTRALCDVAVLALALAASFAVVRPEARLVYRSLFHLGVMAWFWRELHALPNGEGLTMLAWAGYALVLHGIARRVADQLTAAGTTVAAHFALDAALGVLAFRLATGWEGASPLLNEKAGIDLLFMGLAFGASFLVKQPGIAVAYRMLVHVAALGWLLRESTPADFDQGYVMLRWALYLGMLAFVAHRVRDKAMLMFVNCAWLGVAYLFALRLPGMRTYGTPFLNSDALVDVAVVGIAFAAQMVAQPRWAAIALRIAAHASVLGLLARELWVDGYGIVMVCWAAYATGVMLLSRRLRDEVTLQAANVAFLAVGMLLGARLLGQPEGIAFANWTAVLDVATVTLAVAASFLCRPPEATLGYRLVTHGAVLLLFYRELYPLEYGADLVMLAWSSYAACLYFAGRMLRDEATRWSGYAVFGAAGSWLLLKIAYGLIMGNPDAPAVFTVRGISDLLVIAVGAGIFPLVRPGNLRLAHGLWLHVTLLGWMWQELGLLESGNAYVTIAWGVYGLGLVIAGYLLNRNLPVMLCGVTTLFVIAGKLFVIDLRYLGTVWQIMLFLGFGGFFLIVSYGFQKYILGRGESGERQGTRVLRDTAGQQAPEKG